MDADSTWVFGARRVMRKDDGDVTNLGHNGVGLVGLALLKSAGMNMDIGDNLAASLPAMRPEIAQSS